MKLSDPSDQQSKFLNSTQHELMPAQTAVHPEAVENSATVDPDGRGAPET
ncbi:hypothetical protein [Aurantiacibacter luteus]|nr:hypothetical protein [Aurantiacibacter luteus]